MHIQLGTMHVHVRPHHLVPHFESGQPFLIDVAKRCDVFGSWLQVRWDMYFVQKSEARVLERIEPYVVHGGEDSAE